LYFYYQSLIFTVQLTMVVVYHRWFFHVLPTKPADIIRLFHFYIFLRRSQTKFYNADQWPRPWFQLAGELIIIMEFFKNLQI